MNTSNQCAAKGCPNTRDGGAFVGDFCLPCDLTLRSGKHIKSVPAAWPMHPDDEVTGEVHGYMCKVDFECELGGAAGGNKVYADIEDCRKYRKCTPQCGIVKVAVRCIEVVQPEDYGDLDL